MTKILNKPAAALLLLAVATASAGADTLTDLAEWKQQWEAETRSAIALEGAGALVEIHDISISNMKIDQAMAIHRQQQAMTAARSASEDERLADTPGGELDRMQPAAREAVNP